jgi:NAD(P)H-hydrate epimerase
MSKAVFRDPSGRTIPALSADEMREVDRLAVEVFHLGLLQMMENAGRNLARVVMSKLGRRPGPVVVLAGPGGNGGGGLCCARHLHNWGIPVSVLLTRRPDRLSGAAQAQWRVLQRAALTATPLEDAATVLREAQAVVDALIGYSLRGAPRGAALDLIQACNAHARQVIALDVPSGIEATTGGAPGRAVRASCVVTLALPKTGLAALDAQLFLADLGIPPQLYSRLGLQVPPLFEQGDWLPIQAIKTA